MHNGLMATTAARHVGVKLENAAQALDSFINARRRLELRGEVNDIKVYDDSGDPVPPYAARAAAGSAFWQCWSRALIS